MVIGNQVEAGGERAVRSNQGTVVSSAAVPEPHTAPHSLLEGLDVLHGIDHRPALALFVDDPVQELVHFIVFVPRDAQHVVMMFVVIHVDEALGRFIEVVISPDMVLVGNLGQQLDVLDVCPANVDIEEDDVTVFFLPFDQVAELWLNTEQGLG